jgi:hypothetical protein
MNTVAGKADGTADLLVAADNNGGIIYGSAINNSLGVVFPTSGYRHRENGKLNRVGISVLCWSGSAYDDTAIHGHHLSCDETVRPGNVSTRSFAFPVRCVRN